MSPTSKRLLLLSGAGLPAWIWDEVRRHLGPGWEAVVAPRPPDPHAGLGDHARSALDAAPDGAFTIVAHSSGGVVGGSVSRLAPERVAGVLAVSAVIPPPGGSFLDAMPAPNRWILRALMAVAGTRPPDSSIRRNLAGDLDDAATERLVDEFVTESRGLYRDRLSADPWSGWRGYVCTTRDRELTPALQRRSAERLGAGWGRELEAGHLPMLEAPAATASAIAEFVATQP